MAHPDQELQGPDGFRLRLVGIEPELLEMEATYPGGGMLPPPHFHPQQAERFEVIEGTIRAVVDGSEHTYEAGEAFDVPAGIVHQMTADGPARTRWEVRPALRTAEFFERLYDALERGDGEALGAIFSEFAAEFQLAGI